MVKLDFPFLWAPMGRHGRRYWFYRRNGQRIPMFRDSNRESLELDLFSTEPVHEDYEILRLTDSLTDFTEQFGADDPMVTQVLAGKSPPKAETRARGCLIRYKKERRK